MRNENGFGSIICLDKTGKKRRKPWAVRVTSGWVDGKQQRKYLGYYASKSEALIALADYHKSGTTLDMTNITLAEAYDKWIARVEKKASTTVMNAHQMTRNRYGVLEKKKLKEIKANHLQEWMDGIELKAGTKKKIKSCMSQLYDWALSNDIVNKNYAKSIEINEKDESTGAIFTEDELKVLWDNVDKEDYQYVLILIYTGVRVSELLEMPVENINFEESYMIGGNKTEAGKDRIIPIHNQIMPLIKERMNDKYLVPSRQGGHLEYHSMQRRFQKIMKTHNWNHRLHDTRKTGISIMHSAGIPMETIRIIVGHSGQGVTEKVYLFKEPSELVEAINTVKI